MTVTVQTNSSTQGRRLTSSIAMTVLLISWAMFFATLFMAFSVYRFTSLTWPPMGMDRVELMLPTISTFIILLSSGTYWKMQRSARLVNKTQLKVQWTSTVVLGLAFLIIQFLLWNKMREQGLYVEAGPFASLMYAFTWVHAAHILLGLIGLLWVGIFVKGYQGTEDEKESLLVLNIGKFWHFLTIVWLGMYFSLFVF